MLRGLKLFVAVVALGAPASALAGPFGFEMGEDASLIPGCSATGSSFGVYQCKTVRRPHPDIANYFVRSFPGVGVCWIKAVTPNIPSDSFGVELKRSVESFVEQLNTVYSSNNKKMDYLMAGSLWKEEKYWMMGLLKGERTYVYYWSEKVKSVLKDGLTEVSVSANPATSETGWVAVEYRFSNMSKCQEAELKAKAGSL